MAPRRHCIAQLIYITELCIFQFSSENLKQFYCTSTAQSFMYSFLEAESYYVCFYQEKIKVIRPELSNPYVLDSCQLLNSLIIFTADSLKSKEVCVPSCPCHFQKCDSQHCQSEGLKSCETRLHKLKNNHGIATLACFLTS